MDDFSHVDDPEASCTSEVAEIIGAPRKQVEIWVVLAKSESGPITRHDKHKSSTGRANPVHFAQYGERVLDMLKRMIADDYVRRGVGEVAKAKLNSKALGAGRGCSMRTELGRDDVEPLGDVLADPVQGASSEDLLAF